MKQKELKQIYPYNDELGGYIIDVQLDDYRDAYSVWDFSPFTNRDLDEDLMKYLLECSYEIPLKYSIIINYHILNQKQNQIREDKSIKGMYNYFKYGIRKLINYRIGVVRDSIAFFIAGSVLLILGAYLKKVLNDTILFEVLSEGLFIGGWVMIWEMFSTWFFDVRKATRKIKHLKRLQESTIKFKYSIKDKP
ncbi:MAG: hypothetical protein JXQ23_06160 [Clostridia bacterium]|nr:hypothetical protein [Clostridia bacterium]